MAKRFATMFFIMIGVVVFLLSAFMLVLFLVPGVSMFGIKYIAVNTHGINTGKVAIEDAFLQKYGSSDFSGSIIVNSDDVPIIVEFAESGQTYYYQYYDNFNGITTSMIENPKVSLTRDANGNAVFDVESYKKFVFENGNSLRFLKLFIPLANISVFEYQGKPQYVYGESDLGASLRYKTNLTINSENASVEFHNIDKSRAPAFNKLSIKTNGNINYNDNHIKAMTFALDTDTSIIVSSDVYAIADAKNYDLKTSKGSIKIIRSLSGDLSATTKNGNVELYACNNLYARTDLGDIKCSHKDREVSVNNVVDIMTNAGSINIKSILGNGLNKIETGSGSVNIHSLGSAQITTHRGAVKIKSVKNAIIVTNTGNVSIEEVLESIDVSTKRGKINLGGEGMVLNSPKATSHLGKIQVIDASGKVDISTISSDVYFKNKNSSNIKIVAGGKLEALNLKGVVDINVSETAYLEFDSIANETKILVEDSCSYIKIDALSTLRTQIDYSFAGKPVTIYEANNTGYATYSMIESKEYVYNENRGAPKFQIIGDNILGKVNARVDVYFNKSNNPEY